MSAPSLSAARAARPGARAALTRLAVAVLLLLPLLLPTYQVTVYVNVLIAALVALGLVLLTGVVGLTSFGQAAFMGVGAYTTAYLCTAHGWNPWLTLLAGLAVTAVVALVLGAVTLRLRGHYLPLATIAWGLSLYYTFGNTPALGNFTGISNVPPVSVFGLALLSPRAFAYLALAALLLASLGGQYLLSSRTGRALRALRAGPQMAEAFGVPLFSLRVQVFVLSALLASFAGWLFAHNQRFVNPSPFGVQAGIEDLFMVVVGGIQYVWGGLLGAGLLTELQEGLRSWLPRLTGQQGNFEGIIFGVLVILTLHLARLGLWPLLERALPASVPPRLPEPLPLARRAQPLPGSPLLEVRSAVKQFGGLRAVNDVSFTLRAGEILGLIGPNGAGKSTMFNLISGVSPATGGTVTFAGRDVTRLSPGAIHRLGLARTFQHVKLLPELSLLDNTMMGGYSRGRAGVLRSLLHLERREEAALRQEALRQLERVGLAGQAGALAGNLPLGQQRVLEVARALVADPALLLLDEPAAGLRYGEKLELAALLQRLRGEGLSILIVEHDMELVMNLVDRLVVMNYGTRLAEGLPAEVRAHREVREAYLGADSDDAGTAGAA